MLNIFKKLSNNTLFAGLLVVIIASSLPYACNYVFKNELDITVEVNSFDIGGLISRSNLNDIEHNQKIDSRDVLFLENEIANLKDRLKNLGNKAKDSDEYIDTKSEVVSLENDLKDRSQALKLAEKALERITLINNYLSIHNNKILDIEILNDNDVEMKNVVIVTKDCKAYSVDNSSWHLFKEESKNSLLQGQEINLGKLLADQKTPVKIRVLCNGYSNPEDYLRVMVGTDKQPVFFRVMPQDDYTFSVVKLIDKGLLVIIWPPILFLIIYFIVVVFSQSRNALPDVDVSQEDSQDANPKSDLTPIDKSDKE